MVSKRGVRLNETSINIEDIKKKPKWTIFKMVNTLDGISGRYKTVQKKRSVNLKTEQSELSIIKDRVKNN